MSDQKTVTMMMPDLPKTGVGEKNIASVAQLAKFQRDYKITGYVGKENEHGVLVITGFLWDEQHAKDKGLTMFGCNPLCSLPQVCVDGKCVNAEQD